MSTIVGVIIIKYIYTRVCQKSIFLSNQFSQVGYVWEYVSGCTTFFFRIFEQKLSQRQPLQDLITFNKYLVFSGQYSSQNSCLNHKILSAKSDCCTHRKQFFQHGTMVAWYHGTMVLQNSSDSTMVLQNSSDSTIMIF